jgi:putative oxidoreductase
MKTIFTASFRYRIAKAFIIFFMLFSAYYSFTHPGDFQMLGFPNYFRIQLSILKVIGVIVLVLPKTPVRIREWVYVAFGICIFSALIAHISSGDELSKILFVSIDSVLFVTSAVIVQRYEKAAVLNDTASRN